MTKFRELVEIIYTEKIISGFIFNGCSLFGGGEKAEIIFRMDQSEFFTRNSFTIHASDGKNVIRVEEIDDFESEIFTTRNRGTLELSFEVFNSETEILAQGDLNLDLRDDWRWGVRLRADGADYDPLEGCFGCHSYSSFAINRTVIQDSDQVPDSLYVIVGGNYISEPLVY